MSDQPQYGERVPGYRAPQASTPVSPQPAAPRRSGGGFGRILRPGGSTPIVTWVIVALCVVVYIAQFALGSGFTNLIAYYPPLTVIAPWQMLTSAFAHANFLHILFNMYALLAFGPMLELWLGRGRYVTLYLISAFAGSVAVLWIAPGSEVLGASGAIFGVLAACVVVQHGLGANPFQLILMIVLNLAIGIFTTGVSWQAHVGGLAIGALLGWIFMRNRGPRRRNRMIWLVVAVGVGLVLLTALGAAVRAMPLAQQIGIL